MRLICPVRYIVLAGVLTLASLSVAGVADAALPFQDQPTISVHTVEPGETVGTIAAAYGVSSETVLAANTIDDPDLLKVGQQLLVPPVDGALHTVQPGETLRAIADAYGVDVADVVSANGLDASPDLLSVGLVLVVPGVKPDVHPTQQVAATAPSTVDRAPDTYTVREGDTLRSIAETFNLDILSLVAINGVADPDLITPGSTLRLSSSDTFEHAVQPGETLGDIAWRYSVDSSVLLDVNGLADPDHIVIGTTLVIPSGRSTGTPRPSASPSSPTPPPPAPAAPAQPSAPLPASAPPAPAAPAQRSPPSAPAAPAPTASAPAETNGDRVTSARVTGYATGAGAVSTRTASGTTVHWGTVAADTHIYPFGTRLRIEGLGDTVFVVEDTGSAVRGNVFDVWFPDAESARSLGARTHQVTILGP